MSELIVVRHGQASFLTEDYDRLSDLGREQSRRLGCFWAREGIPPTRMIVGPRKRHQQSAEAIAAGLADAGVRCPDLEYDTRLDEFDWDSLLAYADGTLTTADVHLAALKEGFYGASDVMVRRRAIQHYMEAVTHVWAAGAFHEEGIESWGGFCARVETAVRAHTEGASRGSRIALITSGGVAAAIAGVVLDLAPNKTVDLIWTLRNGALVEYLFSGGRFSLSAYNNAPHLPERRFWTYR